MGVYGLYIAVGVAVAIDKQLRVSAASQLKTAMTWSHTFRIEHRLLWRRTIIYVAGSNHGVLP